MRSRLLFAVVLAVALALGACSGTPSAPRTAVTHGVDPAFVHGTDRGPLDRLAATTATDVQLYWSQQYPEVFDEAWRDIDGGFHSVDTTTPSGTPPPCAGSTSDLEGNAYYCAAVDAIAWDRSALLPVLQAHYGDAAVIAVLAHEIGHAVQQRAGLDVGGASEPLLLETMADCYSGAYAKRVVDGRSPHLRLRETELDGAMRALLAFRDPVGTDPQSGDAHGTAYDRVTAFQDGYQLGPRHCAALTSNGAQSRSTEPQPHVEFDTVLRSDDLRQFFAGLQGAEWSPPPSTRSCSPGSAVATCGRPAGVAINRDRLQRIHRDVGDHATVTLLASRYAVASLAERGRPTTGPAAGYAATCLTGAYLRARETTAADLDEAVETLLTDDQVSRGSDHRSTLSGLDRVEAFRSGLDGGPGACG